MNLFARTEMVFGSENMAKISSSTVAVAGLGGVGSTAAEMLARSGFGTIIIVDFDTISDSDTNRQLIATTDTIGKKKTDVTAERLLKINPSLRVIKHHLFCEETNRDLIFSGCDYIVDAIDSLGPKAGLLEHAYHKHIKIISCMGAGNRIDPSQITIDDISVANGCPLLKRVKKYLRKRGIETGIPIVYSKEPPLKSTGNNKINETFRGRNRETIGSVAHIPIMFAGWAVYYVLKSISGYK